MTKIKSITPHGGWQRALNAARLTANKEPLDKEPTHEWKMMALRSEHSPIRLVEYDIIFENIPYYVAGHFVRHHSGTEKFVSTQRDDRTDNDTPRTEKPQGAPVTMMMSVNAQAIINISRKRLCRKSSPETREVWQSAIHELAKIDPELASFCVPECVRCGFCPEMQSCGLAKTNMYQKIREQYLKQN